MPSRWGSRPETPTREFSGPPSRRGGTAAAPGGPGVWGRSPQRETVWGRSPQRDKLLILGFGLGIVALFVAGEHILTTPSPRPPAYALLVFPFGSIAAELVAASVVTRALERRGMSVVGITVGVCLVGMAVSATCAFFSALARGPVAPQTTWILVQGPLVGLQVYGLWVMAFRYPQLIAEARVQALEKERERQAAELAHLREHLQPHFLRNTLNAISALVTEDPAEARNLLATLGDLLSESIARTEPFRSLGEELDWLRRYTEILEVRYRGALRFTWDDDAGSAGAQVPRLLLQPLVENAILHGALARHDRGGEVTIRTRPGPRGGTVIEVHDNGPGFDPAARVTGIGLQLVRRRVQLEASGAFHIHSSPTGTRAVVELP